MNIPEGWKLVPVGPTREMRRAAIDEYEDTMDARLPDGDGDGSGDGSGSGDGYGDGYGYGSGTVVGAKRRRRQ